MEFILTILFLITAALTVCQLVIHNSRSGKLINKIPGGKGLPIIGNVLNILVPKEELWPLILKWSNIYYPIFKFWLVHTPIVLIRHPSDIQILISSQKLIRKGFIYDLLHPWLKTGLLTSNGTKWRQRRKILTPAFHFNVLHDFLGVFVETAEQMAINLKEKRGEVVEDAIPLFSKYMLRVICETAMGTIMQDDDAVHERYRRSLKLVGELSFYRVSHPWWINDWLFSWTPMGRAHAEAVKVLHAFTSKIIEKRKRYHEVTGGQYLKLFSSGKETVEASVPRYDAPLKRKRLAMLDLLIATQNEHGTIDDSGIREEVDTFIFEGHDTTTIALSCIVLQLAEHKNIQARARAEIESILKKSNGELTMRELQSMEYLERCIKESVRLYPPAYNIGRRLTEDLNLKNFVVPSGTQVFMDVWSLHRDPNVWTQPMVFDPDRFLPEKFAARHPFSYIPFSAGPRSCIGRKYAMLEMKVFLAVLLRDFYFEPMIKLSELHMLPDLLLKMAEPLMVKFVPIRR